MSNEISTTSRRAWLKRVGLGAVGFSIGVAGRGQSLVGDALLSRYPELRYTNLAGNENPFGPSQKVSLAIMREVSNSSRYPFREEDILKERLAELEGVLPENILLGNGCDEILSLAGDVFGRPGRAIVSSRPTYLQLMRYAEKNGAEISWVDHDAATMRHNLPAMLQVASEPDVDLVYVCNPDTPSGTILRPAEIEDFCRAASEHCPVFLDEVYLELLPDYRQQTQVELVREGLPLIIGRSFSKMHGLAGHRVGYAIGPTDLLEKMGERKMSSLGWLGVAAARASIDDRAFHRKSIALIAEGRQRFCSLLDELGLSYTPSVGNFVFHHTGIEIRSFQRMMKERGFLVGRPFPPYEDWCRISIGLPQEMAAYAKAMREVFV